MTWLQAGWSGEQLLAQARDFLRTVHFWATMQWVVVITYWCFRTTYWFHLLGFLIPGDGTDTLSRHIAKELALLTVSQPRRVKFSSTSSWNHARDFFSFPEHHDQLCGPPSLLFNWYRGSFYSGYSSQDMKLIIHLPNRQVKIEWS